MGGRIPPEWVAGFNRNQWPVCAGIRNAVPYGRADAVAAAKTLENNAPAARRDRPDLDPIHLSDAGIKALRPGQQLDGVDEAATELQAFAAEMKRALSSF